MQEMFDKNGVCEGASRRASEMRTAIRIIDRIASDDLFTFDRDEVEDYKEGEDFSEYLDKVTKTYKCLVYVNTRNAGRFFPAGLSENTRKYIVGHPHELYEIKARRLLFEYLGHYFWDWWD